MVEEFDRQAVIDDEHLKLLSIGYMISAAMTAFFSLFILLYVMLGAAAVVLIALHPTAASSPGQAPTAALGWAILGISLGIFGIAIGLAAAKYRAAVNIKRRSSRTFCLIVAGIACIGFPYGTILGVMTFIVFGRPSVMRQFARARMVAAGPAA